MIGQIYTAAVENVAVSAAQDAFEILSPADASIEILSARIGQTSDAGDSEAEMMSVSIVRGEGATSGSGGTTPTPAPHMAGFAASGCTVEANNTTKMTAGGGSVTTLLNDSFNVQIGWLYQPVPEERIVISGGDRLTIELVDAPADAITADMSVTYREIGG